MCFINVGAKDTVIIYLIWTNKLIKSLYQEIKCNIVHIIYISPDFTNFTKKKVALKKINQ